MEWKTVDRPGYFGNKRDEMLMQYDFRYGKGRWKIAWQWGKQVIERSEALQIYEDGYYEHFKAKPELLDWLTENFSDVYDTAPSNINAKFSYEIQETVNNHLHDVAIRRAVLRQGRWFTGEKLLEVRSTNGEGWILSPCNVPFHLPDMIYQGETKYQGEERDFEQSPPWWITKGVNGSVEEFYQQNKILQVLLERMCI
ncbi:MAG TPA: hypothetical protein VJK03_02555 [Candidatus Nanoarchaeia archaeon]|nr:hypothetical protein [Candidatus Nanoarchaeia archaeon]